jgi:hypothetical protein
MGQQKCPKCRERKPKRSCPALADTICTVCCATKRLVEIHCPPDCTYLSSARSHPPAVVQRRQERDVAFVLPFVADLSEMQYQLLLVFQSATVTHAASAAPPLRDEDVAAAADAAAATLETAGKGIIYQHQAVSVPAERLRAELARIVADLAARAGAHQARLERDAAVALRRLEQCARTAPQSLAGDEPPIFLNLLKRVIKEPAPTAAADTAPPTSGLIIAP